MINQIDSTNPMVLGYGKWKQDGTRALSKKVEFGAWWLWKKSFWQVAWIEDTGELFAAERAPSDRFVVLTSLGKKEVTDLMRKWFDGNSLEALLRRFAPTAVAAPEEPVQ